MKITGVAISDTHNQLNEIVDKLPAADILVHCGDLTGRGGAAEAVVALQGIGSLRDRYKALFVTPGNHDWFAFQAPQYWTAVAAEQYGINLLIDRAVHLAEMGMDLRIYGSPWSPFFHDWAFNFPNPNVMGGAEAAEKAAIETWAEIVPDVDLLITHGPPFGILDEVAPISTWQGREYVDTRTGCPHLRERIKALDRLKVHCFGHIHEANGIRIVDGVTYINAAICNRDAYAPVQPFREFTITTIDRIELVTK